MRKLRPSETIQKLLISTTSRLLGEFDSERLLVTHAWHSFHDHRKKIAYAEGPLSRSPYVVAFETPTYSKEAGSMLPDYTGVGDIICVYLSILYGKRFDSHGLIEGGGFFQVPDYSMFQTITQSGIPQNSHSPRCDVAIPLNLVEISRIEPLIHSEQDERFIRFLQAAGRFYLQALQHFEERPDVAYLNLITAGEVLSNYYDYDKDELLDAQAKDILYKISSASDGGEKLAKQIKGRLYQVKRRFVKAINDLLKEQFFSTSESVVDAVALKKEDIGERLSAAYDLRSRHVHSGIPFGKWMSMGLGGGVCEIQYGTPVVGDKEFEKILAKAPTYYGLERIIRYCLLRFIHTHGISIDPQLGDLN